MAELQDTPVETTGPNGTVNGVNGTHRPVTPPNKTGIMSLTEYSANPQTPSPEKREKIRSVVPEDFLLPDGYPDVSTRMPDCP